MLTAKEVGTRLRVSERTIKGRTLSEHSAIWKRCVRDYSLRLK